MEEKIHKDRIEEVKQEAHHNQKEFLGSVRPRKNHTLFEVNLETNTIEKAVFDALPAISFEDAAKGNLTAKKCKITKKPNCIYISALNKKNVIKILERNFNVTQF
ncbi:hypothetical protein [Flavobacterium sp. UMI-01]|uniref:hypothetical protein n=1 Tax=Flavobacterium sp. UMI-01 TaxID=1441053 RepID=UPI001C7DA720|nr:hypothetical protein [Flavobacterium sp. UMI-01]GIZ08364.1 hypothetical protein FUMI01_10910 [Flavobacterium sp. UMI-01]